MNRNKILLFFFIVLSINNFAQNLSPEQQQRIEELNRLNSKYISENKISAYVNNLITIGNIYVSANLNKEAIKSYEEAKTIIDKTNNDYAKLQINNQLGLLYSNEGNHIKAEEFFKNSYKIAEKLNKREEIINATMNLAQCYFNQKKYSEAASKYEEAFSKILEISNNYETARNIATKIAICYKEIGNAEKSTYYYNLATNFERQLSEEKIRKKQQELILQQRIAQENKLKFELEQIKNQRINDSLAKQIAINKQKELEIQYLERIKEKQKLELELKQKEIQRRRNLLILMTIIVFLIALGLAITITLTIKINRQKEELNNKNIELNLKNIEIQEKNAELQKLYSKIRESIDYASKIQKAILPMKQQIDIVFKDNFILYLPKDIVSGDFYWFYEAEEWYFIAGIDCTGHSVPGAFMSLIANNLLNEIIKTQKIYTLSDAIKLIDLKLKETLHSQQLNDNEIQDGMDLSIIKINKKQRKAQIASVNQSVIYIVDNEFNIYEGSMYSIGSTINFMELAINELEIDLGQEAIFYLFSDGYADQFNIERKKYSSKRFFGLIKNNYNLPLKIQQNLYLEEFLRWKGHHVQIDDVLIIGIKY